MAAAEHVAAIAETAPSVDTRARLCFACREPMFPAKLGAIDVETCPAHGTWFDAKEVTRLVDALAIHRVAEEKARRGEPIADPVFPAPTLSDLVLAAVKLPYKVAHAFVDLLKDGAPKRRR